MPNIGRRLYHEAFQEILGAAGQQHETLGLCKVLIEKSGRKLFVDVAGKNLPYIGSHGQHAFPWETHLPPSRLDRIDTEARKYEAESWIAFCYAILREEYMCHFEPIATLEGVAFGARLIRTEHYRRHMRPRSPSWSVVDLPREEVIKITCNPKDT